MSIIPSSALPLGSFVQAQSAEAADLRVAFQSRPAPPSVLAPIMQRHGLPSAAAAARIHAHQTLGIADANILSILPDGQPDPADRIGWLPQRITYASGRAPSAAQLRAIEAKAHGIGRLSKLVGAEAASVALTLFATVTAGQGAQLAARRALLDEGFKRLGVEAAASLARRQAATVAGVTGANAMRIAATDNAGKLAQAMQDYNALFRAAYDLREVTVR